MPKTKEELTELKTEYETLTSKLKDLTEEELKEVTGGFPWSSGFESQEVCAIYMGYNTSTLYTECPSEKKGQLSECSSCPLNTMLGEEEPTIDWQIKDGIKID